MKMEKNIKILLGDELNIVAKSKGENLVRAQIWMNE